MALAPKRCVVCGTEFVPRDRRALTCSKSCGARKREAAKTPEQRSAAGRKAQAAMMAATTPEQRSAAGRKASAAKHAATTPEQRSAVGRKGQAARMAATTPEQRSEIARKREAAKTPEQRSEIARKMNATVRERKIEADPHMLRILNADDPTALKIIALMFDPGATEGEKDTCRLRLRSRYEARRAERTAKIAARPLYGPGAYREDEVTLVEREPLQLPESEAA